MQCYACQNEAEAQCPRCANPYCENHGSELCARCQDPVYATPSATVFRFALVGLVSASVLALWLIVRPPDVPEGSTSVVQPVPTAEPADADAEPSPLGPTPTIPPAETPAPTVEATPTPVPATPTPEPTPAPTPTPVVDIEYTVVEGDTWYGLAEFFGIDAEALAAYNGYTLEDILDIGQVIVIPQ